MPNLLGSSSLSSTRSRLAYYGYMATRVRPLKAAPKVFNYLKYRASRRLPILKGSYTPQIASLMLNTRCNLTCSFCNVGNLLNKPDWREFEGSLEKVQRIFSHPLFRNALLVDLLGGEPLLVKDFDRIIAFLTSRGHLTNTSTNGVYLARCINDLKRAGISRINISLYDENRDVLERDLAQINRVFPVHTSLVLLKSELESRLEHFVDLARFVHEAGCRSLRFFLYRPIGRDPQAKDVISHQDPAYVELRRRIDSVVPGFCFWPAPPEPGPVRKRCVQLWQRIGCDMQGNLMVCCGIESPITDVNVFSSSAEALLNHPKIVDMRRRLLDPSVDAAEPCQSCDLINDPGW